MADVNQLIADFRQKYGEEAVVTALSAYETHRQRSKDYAEKSKAQRAALKEFISKAKSDPDIQKKLADLGISL